MEKVIEIDFTKGTEDLVELIQKRNTVVEILELIATFNTVAFSILKGSEVLKDDTNSIEVYSIMVKKILERDHVDK